MDETLQGQLSEGVLVNVMQYLAMNGETGSLALRHPQGEQGKLFFEEGKVVHVSLGSHRDVRAMAKLLEWCEGNYAFRPNIVTARTMRSSIERLLLESVMHADVSKKHGYNPFYEDSILTAKPLRRDQIVSLSIRAIQLLPQLDGLRTLGEISRTMPFDLTEILESAKELYNQGFVEARATTITSSFISDLKLLVINIMGPMGEIIVDDTLYELGVSAQALPKRVIPELLRELEQQMRHQRWREQFDRGAQHLCLQYGVAVSA